MRERLHPPKEELEATADRLRKMMQPPPPSIQQQNEWITERTFANVWSLTIAKAKALPREEAIELIGQWTLFMMQEHPRVERWLCDHAFPQPTTDTDASVYQLAFKKAQAKQSDLSD